LAALVGLARHDLRRGLISLQKKLCFFLAFFVLVADKDIRRGRVPDSQTAASSRQGTPPECYPQWVNISRETRTI
jgi:hypothetical protein